MGLTQQEMEIASTVLRNLKGKKYKDWNSLFLAPFDLKEVPGYLDVVERVTDLQSVTQALEKGQYSSLGQVWDEIKLVFENALKYHGPRGNSWICKSATGMIKFLNKERKSAEKKLGGGGASAAASSGSTSAAPKAPTIKLKMGKQLPMAASKGGKGAAAGKGAGGKGAAAGKGAAKAKASKAAKAAEAASVKSEPGKDGTAPPKPKKPKLKVKLPTKKQTAEAPAPAPPPAPASKPPKPVIRLKLSKAGSSVSSSKDTKPPTPASSAAAASAPKPPPPTKSSASSTKSSSSTKISLKVGNSRGKELPKGVVQPPAPPKSSASSKSGASASKAGASTSKAGTSASSKASASASSKVGGGSASSATPTPTTSSVAASNTASATTKAGQKRKRTSKKISASTSSGGLPPEQLQACAKVLLGLRRRKQKDISWFLSPVTDKTIISDYRSKIKHPMNITKVEGKVENKAYKNINDFCLDMRRIFSNCVCYNTSMKDAIRGTAIEVMETSEDLMSFFFAQANITSYTKLLYCWKLCMEVLGTLYNVVNPTDGQPTVLIFLHPVKLLCGGQFPPGYLDVIKKPMDFQTVTSNLLEGKYQTVAEFSDDCRLIVQNCNTYYSGKDEGKVYVEQANRLGDVMAQQLEQLARYDKSSKAAADRMKANSVSMRILRPPAPILMSVLDDLRALKYSDKATKIVEPAMAPFETPVSLTVYPDYSQYIADPMDLQTVQSKVQAGAYATAEDFEYDMNLIFRNCEKYHSQRNGEHLVSMAKQGSKSFRRVFSAKMKALEDPSSAPQLASRPESVTSQSPDTTVSGGPPSKKQKVDGPGGTMKKAAPRISITLSASSQAAASRGKSPKPPGQPQKKGSSTPKATTAANQPVPLHIAIARVKEAFPLRRAVKTLQTWEADCARYFKELLRHPWLSAARPKFIFHVPVTMLFPELRDAYAAKIKKPMDLTTVECTLLAGNRYTSCEDLIDDVALTFSNAIRFNKDGRDLGDPLSCAYYDASVHLLRYARWLSLELLSKYVEDIDHVDEGGADGLPPLTWRLTRGNREFCQKEQQDIVLKEPIEKSLEGDRYSWHETECEKLLKALRHQSDLKYMTFFIRADYPADYTAFISKPMDWEKVNKNLKKRHFDNFGQIIEDLRLIFKNALKYNARLKDRADTVSGRAYAAAEYMSNKLEAAIRKLMLSVADRIERERIDHDNAEREMEAAEKAEEARIRAAWKKDPSNRDGSSPPPLGNTQADSARGGGGGGGGGNSLKIRLARRSIKREATDFEIPFFDDEDEAQHERSFIELIKMQKSMFEKQRQELVRMRQKTAVNVGSLVYSRHLQNTLAKKWKEEQTAAAAAAEAAKHPPVNAQNGNDGSIQDDPKKGGAVLKELEREDRGQIKISLKKTGTGVKQKRGKKRPNPFDF